MKTVMTGICLLGLCSASMAAGDAPADALVGCYEAKGNRLLVTWHPAGGIAVADLLGAGVSHLQPNPDEPDLWLEAGDEGKVAAEARFTGIGTDTVTLSWQGPASERERVFSLTGCGYRQGEIVFSRSGIELSALLLLPESSRPHPRSSFHPRLRRQRSGWRVVLANRRLRGLYRARSSHPRQTGRRQVRRRLATSHLRGLGGRRSGVGPGPGLSLVGGGQ